MCWGSGKQSYFSVAMLLCLAHQPEHAHDTAKASNLSATLMLSYEGQLHSRELLQRCRGGTLLANRSAFLAPVLYSLSSGSSKYPDAGLTDSISGPKAERLLCTWARSPPRSLAASACRLLYATRQANSARFKRPKGPKKRA